MNYRRIAALLLLVTAAAMPSLAQAKVQRVGPTQFHKQMQIPNALGKSGSAANSDDGYTAPSRNQKRANKRMKRQREQNAANNAESRTASDSAQTPKRKGRRDRQHDARLNRLQDRAMDRATSRLEDVAKRAVND